MDIPTIKSRLSILDVLGHYHLKTTPVAGKPEARSLHCPFDGHPVKPGKRIKKTFQVYTDTNRYQCFHKDCKAGNGDVIDFIQHQEGCTKHQAILKAKQIIDPSYKAPVASATSNAHSDALNERKGKTGETVKDEVPGFTFSVIRAELYEYRDTNLSIDVLGGIRLEGLDRMRGTLKLKRSDDTGTSIRHTLDLYNDNQVQQLIRKTAERLTMGTSKCEQVLNNLADCLESYRLEELEKKPEDQPKIQPLSERAIKETRVFLTAPNLMQHTNELLGASGIVGEEINRQTLWLVYSSRKRKNPLHVICLGASGTGKTYLQEMVSRFIPAHEKFTFTASTENAFYYLEPYDLCHKVVLIEDMDGVQYLLYPLRELQTKSWISKVVPIKDTQGNMKTKKLDVYGPICLSGTTTKEKLYEDNANRCLLLHLDNSAAQQESIMDYQRKLSAGKINWQIEQEATETLQNIQRMLEPVKVINPYAEALKIPQKCFKPLRTNQHYLQFIETVTWYHQFQRDEKADLETGEVYIETTLEDIEVANQLMKEALLTKSDELPKVMRDFFEQLKAWMQSENLTSFYSKVLRSHFRMYPMKANRYIKTLEQYGYLKRTGGNKKSGYEYEVADWGEYDQLKNSMNILDDLLEILKKREKEQK